MSSRRRRRSLGKIVLVTADRFTVELNADQDSFTLVGFDAQHYVARIGSFVLIPLQAEYVVAEVVGLRDTEASSRHAGSMVIEDGHDLASTKYLDLVPLGTLPVRQGEPFRFGVSAFPPLYSDVLYAETPDIDRILDVPDLVEITGADHHGTEAPTAATAFAIGSSIVFDDYQVKVRVNEFFGGHAAVLGTTGSGKSCTVAAIIQTIFGKPGEYHARGASFVVLDTNGEYRRAFGGLPAPIRRRYAVVSDDSLSCEPSTMDPLEDIVTFRLPHWFMSIEEWELLLRASDRAQRPVLRTALGLATLFAEPNSEVSHSDIRNHVLACCFLAILQSGDSVPASAERIRSLVTVYATKELCPEVLAPLLANNYGAFTASGNAEGRALHDLLESHRRPEVTLPEYTNRPFAFRLLGDALDVAILYEEAHGNRSIRDYCAPLVTRFNSIRDRPEYSVVRGDPMALAPYEEATATFVDALLGCSDEGRKVAQLTIIDMNDVSDEIVEVVSAVVTRLIFERLRRLPDRSSMPVNLVLEEAHRYIAERPSAYAMDAKEIFERVAKEGRKYGLFILLASQRPSELSQTVLSQCTNFVIHRIQNPEDLGHIRRMTPFISESVLRRLPTLPKQHALIFGTSVNVPTSFRVKDVDPRPRSDDAPITELWYVAEGDGHP